MSDNEQIIAVDNNDLFLQQVDRLIAHNPDKLVRHREVMTLLFVDENRVNFLLQKRSLKKKQLPGLWTLSATGHVDIEDLTTSDKDGYLTAAMREVFEEIGVKARNLQMKGKIVQRNSDNWAMMGIVTGEYEGEFRLDTDEVDEVRIFNSHNVSEVSDKLTPGAKACLEFLGILEK